MILCETKKLKVHGRLNLACMLFGVFLSQKINLFGELYIGEMFALLYFLTYFFAAKFNAHELKLLIAGLVWALAQLISDINNNNDLLSSIKGVAAPIVFVLTVVFLMKTISRNSSCYVWTLFGIAIGDLLRVLIFRSEYFIINPWKWGLGSSLLVLYILWYSFIAKKQSKAMLFLVFLAFAYVSFYFDARGMAAMPIFGLMLYFVTYKSELYFYKPFKIGLSICVKLLLFVSIALPLINFMVGNALKSNFVQSRISPEAAFKYSVQSSGDFGVILGGRSEILVASRAFLDKPMFGHGSFAKDNGKYKNLYSKIRYDSGYSLSQSGGYESFDSFDLIPTHSFIMTAAVWSGIIGILFWCYISLRAFSIFIMYASSMGVYYYVMFIGFFWMLLFSPFGADNRWSASVFLAALLGYESYMKFNVRLIK